MDPVGIEAGRLRDPITNFATSWNKTNTVAVFFDQLGEKLKQSGGLLAGGAILSALERRPIKDLDIYVRCSGMTAIDTFLKEQGLQVGGSDQRGARVCSAPAYDQSFFRKNHILARIPYFKPSSAPYWPSPSHKVDLMILPDDVDPRDVVTNFDLTFCEVWWDGGDSVDGPDIAGVLRKQGVLRPEYVESLLKYFNRFILERIEKYRKRGYEISYQCHEPEVTVARSRKTVDPTEWVVKFLYGQLLSTLLPSDQPAFICMHPLSNNSSLEDMRHITEYYLNNFATGLPPGTNVNMVYKAFLESASTEEWINNAEPVRASFGEAVKIHGVQTTYVGYLEDQLGDLPLIGRDVLSEIYRMQRDNSAARA